MTTVSLQTVFDEARRAIEIGAADKAIGIAQHILVHFPRMIEGSRLLGEAYLNAGQPEQAAAAFAQVLDADPENVAAYYGRGLALQSMEQRAAAITSFERALEIQPNLADLRTQLMRLYAETPGSAGQFRLSRAGLGRLYARGGMFGQAIDEFRAVLDTDGSRADVKVALAEALWRDGQEDEATEFCRDVLDQSPELLKPTVLLGYMLVASGQPEGEALWRRAAAQDAPMALAHTLFDILPPIRIEEPVLPGFDEAEWRAKEARRAASQPQAVPAAVAPAVAEDDFFADSWLNTAGTSAAVERSAQIRQEPVAAPAVAQAGGGDSDDDLLASLLGFADAEPALQPVEPVSDFGDVQPFAFDDWDAAANTAQRDPAQTQPLSLSDIGLEDTPLQAESDDVPSTVQPFSLDDWSFEDDNPEPGTPVTQASTADTIDLDLSDIEEFRLDDDSSDAATNVSAGPQPFTLDEQTELGGDVKPFSLDDDDDFGIAPFSFDQEQDEPSATADVPATADAGLGAVQPFSLDDWGMDDNEVPAASASGGGQFTDSADAADDFGDFKPFSLDELALDSLENDEPSALSGPMAVDDDEAPSEPTTFNWEEPTWRAHTTPGTESEGHSDESIFAKLLRTRPAEQRSAEPAPVSDDADEDQTFFSMDDEPLRMDLNDFDQNASTSEFFDPVAASQADAEDTATASQPQGEPQAASTKSAAEAALPFSLEDLEASDQRFSWEAEPSAAEHQTNAEQDFVPFSLSELGLSDDDIAALDQQPELAADTAETEAAPELSPFSLSELGLSDDEIAAFDFEKTQAAESQFTEPANVAAPDSETDYAAADHSPAETETGDTELVPFSLSELGLTDDEIALLNQSDSASGEHQEDAVSDESADFNAMLAGLDAEDATHLEPKKATGEAETGHEAWLDLQAQLEVDAPATRTPDDFLEEAQTNDGDVQSVLETMPQDDAADRSVDMVPFSLADLGLNDDEFAQFEDSRSGDSETGAEPGAPEAAAPAYPFSMADFGGEAEQDSEEARPYASSSADEIVLPFTMDQQATPELADKAASVGADDRADLSTEAASSRDTVPAILEESPSQAEVVPAQPLPAELPEGAQPVAATNATPAAMFATPAADVSPEVQSGLAAIHAQLAAEPENDALRFAFARMSQSTGNLNQALEQYKVLIKRGHLLDEVVEDLQDTISEHDEPQILRRLHRLLGDAYMKQNRFREAMDEYSWTIARRT